MKNYIKKVDIAVISIFSLCFTIAILLIFSLAGDLWQRALTAVLLLIGITALLLGVINMYRRAEKMNKKVLHILREELPHIQQEISAQTEAMFWLVQQITPVSPLPATNTWSISPDAINSIVSLIKEHKPQQLIELGGGISTLIFSYVIEKGHIHTFNHQAHKVEETAETLSKHGLSDKATVKFAPLAPLFMNGKEHMWYHTDGIDRIAFINMLIVSGPKADDDTNLLYAAMPHLYPKLKPGALIIVTHANSPHSRATIKEWRRIHPLLSSTYINTKDGLMILRKPLAD